MLSSAVRQMPNAANLRATSARAVVRVISTG